MSSKSIEIDLEPIFSDRRQEDRRNLSQGAQAGGFLVDRREGNRRNSEFNNTPWSLQCNYLDQKRNQF